MPKVRFVGTGVAGREIGDVEDISPHDYEQWSKHGVVELVEDGHRTPEAAAKAPEETAVRKAAHARPTKK